MSFYAFEIKIIEKRIYIPTSCPTCGASLVNNDPLYDHNSTLKLRILNEATVNGCLVMNKDKGGKDEVMMLLKSGPGSYLLSANCAKCNHSFGTSTLEEELDRLREILK